MRSSAVEISLIRFGICSTPTDSLNEAVKGSPEQETIYLAWNFPLTPGFDGPAVAWGSSYFAALVSKLTEVALQTEQKKTPALAGAWVNEDPGRWINYQLLPLS